MSLHRLYMMQLKHIGLLGHLLGQLVLVLPAPFGNQLHIAQADRQGIDQSNARATVGLPLESDSGTLARKCTSTTTLDSQERDGAFGTTRWPRIQLACLG